MYWSVSVKIYYLFGSFCQCLVCYFRFVLYFQTLFEPMFIAVYNVFYSSQPVLAIGIFDQDVDTAHSLKFPRLYAPGISSDLFNKKEFFKSALHGFISSCFLFFLSFGETPFSLGNGRQSEYETLFKTLLKQILLHKSSKVFPIRWAML